MQQWTTLASPVTRFVIAMRTLAVAFLISCAALASAQNFPTKPLRLITAEAGGGNDFGARLIAQGLTQSLGRQVIVDNRLSGPIPGTLLARATPDGHTLLYYGKALWIGPLLQGAPYDALK